VCKKKERKKNPTMDTAKERKQRRGKIQNITNAKVTTHKNLKST